MRILVAFETSRVDDDDAVKRVAFSSFRCQAVGRNSWIASVEGEVRCAGDGDVVKLFTLVLILSYEVS